MIEQPEAPQHSTLLEDDSLIEDIMALQDDSLDLTRTSEANGDTSKIENSSSSTNDLHLTPNPTTMNEVNGDDSKFDSSTPPTNDSHLIQKPNLVDGSPRMHTSKQTVSGTPVIKGVSPYTNLPMGEKWAAGVTDLLDFENLPESIGKYEKMRTLIGKIRAKRIQYEDDDD